MMRHNLGVGLAHQARRKVVGLLLFLLSLLTLAACSVPNMFSPSTGASNTAIKPSVESWQLALSRPLSGVPSSYTAHSNEIESGTLAPDLLGITPGAGGNIDSFNFAVSDYQGLGTYHIAADAVSPQQSQSYFQVQVGQHLMGHTGDPRSPGELHLYGDHQQR